MTAASCSSVSSVPVVALGGCGEEEHIHEVVRAGASAVAVGSMFVFQRPHEAVLISYLKNEIILKECQ